MDLWKFHNGRVQSHRNTCSVNTLFDGFFYSQNHFLYMLVVVHENAGGRREIYMQKPSSALLSLVKKERERVSLSKSHQVCGDRNYMPVCFIYDLAIFNTLDVHLHQNFFVRKGRINLILQRQRYRSNKLLRMYSYF